MDVRVAIDVLMAGHVGAVRVDGGRVDGCRC